MAPFFYFPHTVFVAERGLDHFELSMRAQYELTKRFSAEASIRPYLDRYPEQTLAVLRRWTRDENAHAAREAAARVFKVGRIDLPPRASTSLKATFSLAVHTTRVPRPGRHAVDVLLNGHAYAAGAFHVTRPR